MITIGTRVVLTRGDLAGATGVVTSMSAPDQNGTICYGVRTDTGIGLFEYTYSQQHPEWGMSDGIKEE